MERAVFLDRDGVINKTMIRNGKSCPPANPSELEIFPDIAENLGRLHSAGFKIIVVTNQPDVARGTQTREMVESINSVIKLRLAIDEFLVCYHDTADRCSCRKPKPGLLLQSAEKYGLSLNNCFMVGDRSSDMEAGKSAGCRTILIGYQATKGKAVHPDYRVDNFCQAVDVILKQRGEK